MILLKNIVESVDTHTTYNTYDDIKKILDEYNITIEKDKFYPYRGIKNSWPIILEKPSTGKRISKGTIGNIYTLLIDNLDEWNGYPERSKSIIGCCDGGYASQYGTNLYRVVPLFNDATFGICPTSDIWKTEIGAAQGLISYELKQLNIDIIDFNKAISNAISSNSIIDVVDIDDFQSEYTYINLSSPSLSYEQLLKAFETFDFVKDNKKYIAYFMKYYITKQDKLLYNWITKYKKLSFLNYCKLVLNPSSCDFNKVNFYSEQYDSLVSKNDYISEVWTDSDCLLISEFVFNQILNRLTIKGTL